MLHLFSLLSRSSTQFLLPFVVALPMAIGSDGTQPRAEPDLIFAEQAGVVAVEAEHFSSQALTDQRAFYLTSPTATPGSEPDGDPPHLAGASGGAYLEVLPDTRRTASEHCGEPHKIYLDIEQPGVHTIHFSMREDGFEFDKWLMTKDRDFARPHGLGPDSIVHAGHAPEPFSFVAAEAFINAFKQAIP